MLFNFFKKHERQNTVNEHLSGFQEQFSEKQKKAILTSLLLIANSDREYHRKEERFFEQTATMLDYRLQSDYMDDLMSPDQDELFQILNSLAESQKDWYIITAFGMMHADGKSLEVEFKYLVGFFSRMGITEERYENVLRKTQLLMEKFK